MEITVAGQTWLFLLSVALGAALGVCYDVFRILRIAFRHPSLAVLLEDILFSLAAAGATFAFLLTTGNGQLRAFFLIGEMVEFGETEQVFARPVDRRTEDYITGRFG